MKKGSKESKILKKFLKTPILIDEDFPDLSNDPFVLKKMEMAEKFIAEHGLPDSPKNKSKAKKSARRKA
jgi:hypothetical protein